MMASVASRNHAADPSATRRCHGGASTRSAGAIIKDKWKLTTIMLLQGKTELFDLIIDKVAGQNPEVVRDLQGRLIAYVKWQKTSECMKAQPDVLAAHDKTPFDPDFDIDDGGLPRPKPLLQKK